MGYGRVVMEDVFIISGILDNIRRGRWGAPALKEAILKHLDVQQQMLFITTCQDYSPTMAREKAMIYKSRAWKVALGVAAAGAIPYAGTPINAGIMLTTIELFKSGFGLDAASVGKLATLTGKDAAELKRFVDERLSVVNKIIQFFKGDIDQQRLKDALMVACESITFVYGGIKDTVLLAALAADATVDMSAPVIGGVLTAPVSFPLSWYALHLVVEQQKECVLALYEQAFRFSLR